MGRSSADEQTSNQIEVVAAQLLGAGMTRAAVVELFNSQPNILSLDPSTLAPKLASGRAFLKDETQHLASAWQDRNFQLPMSSRWHTV